MRDAVGRTILAAFGVAAVVAGLLGLVGILKVASVVPSRLFGLSTAIYGALLVRVALGTGKRVA